MPKLQVTKNQERKKMALRKRMTQKTATQKKAKLRRTTQRKKRNKHLKTAKNQKVTFLRQQGEGRWYRRWHLG